MPFVNNYGVWKDEFRELGLEGTLDASWEDASCYFGEGQQVRVGRGYGRHAPRLQPSRSLSWLAPSVQTWHSERMGHTAQHRSKPQHGYFRPYCIAETGASADYRCMPALKGCTACTTRTLWP